MFDVNTSTFETTPPHRLRVGDHVTIDRDVLAELGREAAGLPPTWFCVPAGTHGKLIGWRDREEDSRAIIDLVGTDRRVIVFVGESNVTRATRELHAPPPKPPSRRYRPRHRG
jgi:hypothetical protein